jgi:NAD(P)H-dependent FMN reductase
MLKVAIILGSTRPGRNSESVGRWVYDMAKRRSDASFELVDIKDYNLPVYDEPNSPLMGPYTKEHTKTWSEKIESFDAYVFVTAEYNHGIPGALKNAIDFLYKEWNNKVAGFVGYGGRRGALCTAIAFSHGRVEGCNRTLPSPTIAFYRLRELHEVQTCFLSREIGQHYAG